MLGPLKNTWQPLGISQCVFIKKQLNTIWCYSLFFIDKCSRAIKHSMFSNENVWQLLSVPLVFQRKALGHQKAIKKDFVIKCLAATKHFFSFQWKCLVAFNPMSKSFVVNI